MQVLTDSVTGTAIVPAWGAQSACLMGFRSTCVAAGRPCTSHECDHSLMHARTCRELFDKPVWWQAALCCANLLVADCEQLE